MRRRGSQGSSPFTNVLIGWLSRLPLRGCASFFVRRPRLPFRSRGWKDFFEEFFGPSFSICHRLPLFASAFLIYFFQPLENVLMGNVSVTTKLRADHKHICLLANPWRNLGAFLGSISQEKRLLKRIKFHMAG